MERKHPEGAWGAGTLAVWGGEEPTAEDAAAEAGGTHGGPVAAPVVRSVTFEYDDVDEWTAVAAGRRPGHVYSRNTNPTVRRFEEKVRALEGAEAATAFASGMAAIAATLHALLRPGDRLVAIRDTYGGTNRLFVEFLPRLGIEVALVDSDDPEALEVAIGRGCELVYLESPTNPRLRVVDLERAARAGRRAGAAVVVDNTFATPINQRPLELGCHLVVHSATKALGGHSDVLGGVVCGGAELVRTIFRYREIHGAALDPEAAWLLIRGMKTLELRVERQNGTALRVAERLATDPRIERVHYPGLPEDPGHEVARRQMTRGFGGILSFTLAGGEPALRRFLPRLHLAHRAASLGSVVTLVGPPAMTSHVELTADERASAGIPEGLVRYSVGIENPEDLLADLDQALAAVDGS